MSEQGQMDQRFDGYQAMDPAMDLGRMPAFFFKSSDKIDSISVLDMIYRRRYLALAIFALSLALAVFYLTVTPPQYTARSLVIIEAQDAGADMPMTVGSAVQIMRSSSLHERVFETLSLMDDPEFVRSIEESRQDVQQGAQGISADLLDRFAKKLEVEALEGSAIIQLEYTSLDPQKSALIANTIADSYLAMTEGASTSLGTISAVQDRRLKSMHDKLEGIKDRIDAIQAEANNLATKEASKEDQALLDEVTPPDAPVLSAAERRELQTEIVRSRVKYAEIYERLQAIKYYEEGGAASDASGSDVVKDLRRYEIMAQKELASLEQKYGEKHPALIEARTKLESIKTSIRTEIAAIEKALTTQLRAIEEDIANIQGQLKTSVSAEQTFSMAEKQEAQRLALLRQEIAKNEAIYTNLKTAIERAASQEGRVTGSDTKKASKVISYASVPSSPSYPNARYVLIIAALIGGVLGVMVPVFLEKTDKSIRSISELEAVSGLPNFGAMAHAPRLKHKETARYITSESASTVAEMVRSVRMAIQMRGTQMMSQMAGKSPKIITITSSVSGEGKTTLSTWLSTLTARSGEKVIVLDCDFRRSTLHVTFNCPDHKGLVDYLSEDAGLEDVIYREDPSGVHVIFGRDVPGQALDLVNSKRLHALVQSLGKAYDLVVLDAPTSLSVSDALILAQLSDLTLYCAGWRRTSRATVLAGIKNFKDAGIKNIATVLTRVDLKKYKRYSTDLEDYMA